ASARAVAQRTNRPRRRATRPVRMGRGERGALRPAGRARLGGELAQLAAAARVAELAQRLDLDLADPLAGEAELAADLLERAGVAVVEAEAKAQHTLLPPVERGEHVLNLLPAHPIRDDVQRRDRVLVGDQLAELRV